MNRLSSRPQTCRGWRKFFSSPSAQPSFEAVCHDGTNRRFDDLGGLLVV